MSRTREIHAIIVTFLAAAALAGAARAQVQIPSSGDPGPDAARLRAIEAELRDEARARILGPLTDVEVASPRAHEEGVAFEEVLRRHGGGVPQGSSVGWSEIEKVQVRRSSIGRGALIGTLVGAAIGLAAGLSMTRECDSSEWMDLFCGASATDVANITIGFAGAGLLTGTIAGAPFHHWKTIYDASE